MAEKRKDNESSDSNYNLKKRKNQIKPFIPDLIILDLIMCYLNDDLISQMNLKHLNKHFNENCQLLNKPFIFKLWLQFKHDKIYQTLLSLTKKDNFTQNSQEESQKEEKEESDNENNDSEGKSSNYSEYLNGCVLNCFAIIRNLQIINTSFQEEKNNNLEEQKEENEIKELNLSEEYFLNDEQYEESLIILQENDIYSSAFKNQIIEMIYFESFKCQSAQQVRSGIKFKTIDDKEIILHIYYYNILHGRGYTDYTIYKVNLEDNLENNNEEIITIYESEYNSICKLNDDFKLEDLFKKLKIYKEINYDLKEMLNLLQYISGFSDYTLYNNIQKEMLKQNEQKRRNNYEDEYCNYPPNDFITKIKRSGIDNMDNFLKTYLQKDGNDILMKKQTLFILIENVYSLIQTFNEESKEEEKEEECSSPSNLQNTDEDSLEEVLQKKFVKPIKLECYSKDFNFDEYTHQYGARLKCQFLLNNLNIYITINASNFPNYADNNYYYLYYLIQLSKNDKPKCFFQGANQSHELKEDMKLEEVKNLFNLNEGKIDKEIISYSDAMFISALTTVMLENCPLLDISRTYHYRDNDLSFVRELVDEISWRNDE
ncbi:hypothetical protein ABK040_006030 [Willaertia magna]